MCVFVCLFAFKEACISLVADKLVKEIFTCHCYTRYVQPIFDRQWGFLFLFLMRGFTIADLKVDGKRPQCKESLMTDVKCDRGLSRQWVRKKCWQRI